MYRQTKRVTAWIPVCLGVMLTWSAPAMAQSAVDELQDSFDGGVWQECLWNPYIRQGGSLEYHDWDGSEGEQVRVSGGQLELEIPANTNAGQSWELGLESKFLLAGDFEAEVEFELSSANYWTNLNMRGVNMLFVELMAGDQGTRRRHVRSTVFDTDSDSSQLAAHLWLSLPGRNAVTQINTDTAEFLREISVGTRPGRTSVDLEGNVYVHNRGRSNQNVNQPHNSQTTVTFIKASACPDPDCDLGSSPEHIYTLDFSGGQFGAPVANGRWGGGVAVDRNNDIWVAFRETPEVYHLNYHPSATPGGDTWTVNRVYDISGSRPEFNENARPYGMAFARDGTLWIATRHGSSADSFVRIDPTTGQKAKYYKPPSSCMSPYGLGIDQDQRLYRSTLANDNNCSSYRFDPNEPDEDARWVELPTDRTVSGRSRGMTADNQGLVWYASDGNSKLVGQDQETGEIVYEIDTCSNPAGVALDRMDRVWVSCQTANNNDQVRYYTATGDYLGSVYSRSTYTYSDMTGYQLRNFGLDDWEETFLIPQDETIGAYYTSSVENNFGGGLEYGAGGEVAIDPSQAPMTLSPDTLAATNRPEIHRMRVSARYHTDRVTRIVDHPVRLEGIWGLRTHSIEELHDMPVRFTVEFDSYVYVAFEDIANPVPNWLRAGQGWTSTNEVVETTDPDRNYTLYRRWFAAGSEVTLGGANSYSGASPSGSPFLNYFAYVYPEALDAEPPNNPEAIIAEASENLALHGTLRIARTGSEWTYSFRDGDGSWRTLELFNGPTNNVPIRLRTRMDPFWHSGPQGNLGGSIYVRYNNFQVTHADAVPGSPYCREGCDETTPGWGTPCLGGSSGLCPGIFECVDDQLECVYVRQPEFCNGLDDDCDGVADRDINDEHFEIGFVDHNGLTYTVEDYGMPGDDPDGGGVVNQGHTCDTGMHGPCAAGMWRCVGGAMQCTPFQEPQAETCSNEDLSCDGNPGQDLSDPLVRLDHFVQVRQRSLPNTPMRPIVPDDGEGFLTWAGFDGFNVDPADPNVVEEGVARVVLFLDPTQTGGGGGGHPDLGRYVLWLSHGKASPDQGQVGASYQLVYDHQHNVGNVIMQDGIVKESIISNPARAQQVTVTSGEGQSGGVALGPFDSTDRWTVRIGAHFSGDVHRWEFYNAVTGEGVELSANEPFYLSNNRLGDLYGALTAEVGTPCDTGEPGICGRGATRCVEHGGDWSIECLIGVTPQLEVCDGRDNSCSGEVDSNPDYGFAIPVAQYQQFNGWGASNDNNWVDLTTVDISESATDFLNFTRRSGSGYGPMTGSADLRDVADPTRQLQAPDRSVWTLHRDTRVGNGTLALVMAHGKYVQEPNDAVPASSARVSVGMRHREARENFLAWFDDMDDQSDGAVTTAADSFEAQNPMHNPDHDTPGGTPFYNMDWELHRWVTSGSARREADAAVIMDLFAERTNMEPNEVVLSFDGNGIDDWRYYSPFHENDGFVDLQTNRLVGFQVVTATALEYGDGPECIIQENDVPECLGQPDFYTCQDGQITCGLTRQGCCDPSHPMYDTPCGQDDPAFENTGACQSAWRCDEFGGWECQQTVFPQPEMCSGQDDTCDGIVDGFRTGFVDEYGDGEEYICPDGEETCGPVECDYESICQCSSANLEEVGRACICRDSLLDFLDGPGDRICAPYERLEEDECVIAASMEE